MVRNISHSAKRFVPSTHRSQGNRLLTFFFARTFYITTYNLEHETRSSKLGYVGTQFVITLHNIEITSIRTLFHACRNYNKV